jgi:hypothetical protein
MGSGLMQLIAYGPQNIYLTGNPTTSYFKTVYVRHTNFAMEHINITFDKTISMNPTKRSQVSSKIVRNADLIHDLYLVFDLPSLFTNSSEPITWVNEIGNVLINYYEITVGGQSIDLQYGQWLSIWNELTIPVGKEPAYKKMIGDTDQLKNPIVYTTSDVLATPARRLTIPLKLWFCDNPGLALPLIALQYTDVYINVEFNPLNYLFRIGKPFVSPQKLFSGSSDLSTFNKNLAASLISDGHDENSLFYKYASNYVENSYLIGNYIFLDEDERRRFAQVSHEFLITYVQRYTYFGLKEGPNTLDLSEFVNPVKELIWVFQRDDVDDYNEWENYTIQNQIDNYYYLLGKNKYRYLTLNSDPEITDIDANTDVQDYYTSLRDELIPYELPENINTNFPDFINIMKNATLLFWGNERFAPQDYNFFNATLPYKFHTRAPKDGIYSYPFSINPESDKPHGTCNFSAINKIQLRTNIFEQSDKSVKYNAYVYATTHNIFRIIGGIGQLVWAS